MSYSYRPKTKPCTVERTGAAQGKHKWTFVKNFNQVSGTFGAHGSSMSISLKGLYTCECGERRVGQFSHNAPDIVGLAKATGATPTEDNSPRADW